MPRIFTLIDELGNPLKDLKIHVKFLGNTEKELKTDDKGIVEIQNGVEVGIEEIHEIELGDSAKTISGQHFEINKGGPKSSN